MIGSFPTTATAGSSKLKVLRRLTLRMEFPRSSVGDFNWLSEAILTIRSPVFCEFVLELTGPAYLYDCSDSIYGCWACWRGWKGVDKFLEERFARRGDFKIVIKTDKLEKPLDFKRHVEVAFPLLAQSECIHFDVPPTRPSDDCMFSLLPSPCSLILSTR